MVSDSDSDSDSDTDRKQIIKKKSELGLDTPTHFRVFLGFWIFLT